MSAVVLNKDGSVRKKMGRPSGPTPKVRHRARPDVDVRTPLYITLRAVEGLASFRHKRIYPAIEEAFRRTQRDGFRIIEYSVQPDALHLIAEADSNEELHHGMKSFMVRANRLFNSAEGRMRGAVWADRYECRELTTPSALREARRLLRSGEAER